MCVLLLPLLDPFTLQWTKAVGHWTATVCITLESCSRSEPWWPHQLKYNVALSSPDLSPVFWMAPLAAAFVPLLPVEILSVRLLSDPCRCLFPSGSCFTEGWSLNTLSSSWFVSMSVPSWGSTLISIPGVEIEAEGAVSAAGGMWVFCSLWFSS